LEEISTGEEGWNENMFDFRREALELNPKGDTDRTRGRPGRKEKKTL